MGVKTKLSRFHFETRDRISLACYRIDPLADIQRGIVFTPTLVGGSYLQQFTYFRYLLEEGYSLFSFHYRGHRFSQGDFKLRSCLDDALEVLLSQKEIYPEIPFFGIGTCFSTLPLLAVQHRYPRFFQRIAVANGILHYQQAVGGVIEAISRYGSGVFLSALWNPSRLLGNVMRDFFPMVDQSDESFGNLDLTRTQKRRILSEYVRNRPFKNNLRISTPSLFILGTKDDLLGLNDCAELRNYASLATRHFSDIVFEHLPANHFFDGYVPEVNRLIHRFFSQREIQPSDGSYCALSGGALIHRSNSTC